MYIYIYIYTYIHIYTYVYVAYRIPVIHIIHIIHVIKGIPICFYILRTAWRGRRWAASPRPGACRPCVCCRTTIITLFFVVIY